MKRIISTVLTIVLVFTVLFGFAINTNATEYGGTFTSGSKTFSWSLDSETGVLTISGQGEMSDSNFNPGYLGWINGVSISKYIKTVYFEEGITKICKNAFVYSSQKAFNLSTAYVSKTVTAIESGAFSGTILTKIYIYAERINIASDAVSQNVTVYGYAGTSVETYANNYGRTFKAICLEHSPVLVGNVDATCEKSGYSGDLVCNVCGIELQRGETIKELGHNYVIKNNISPTCTESGYSGDMVCSRCSIVREYGESLNELGHNFGEWQMINSPTCDKQGGKIRFCQRCEYYETDTISALNHFAIVDSRIEPTCTHNGLTEGTHCAFCGKILEKQQIIAAKGHSFINKTIIESASKLGYITHTCSVCKYSFKDSFKAPTGKPAGFKCSARTATAMKFTWTKTAGVSGYQIQISNAKGTAWATSKALTANSHTFSKLTAGSGYKARVRFYITKDGKNYYGAWSTINSPTLPAGSAISKLTAAKKAFTVQWKKASVTGYQLQYATNAKFTKATTKTIKGATKYSLKVSSLKANTKYFVRVRTYKTIGGKNYYSTWSGTKAVKTK